MTFGSGQAAETHGRWRDMLTNRSAPIHGTPVEGSAVPPERPPTGGLQRPMEGSNASSPAALALASATRWITGPESATRPRLRSGSRLEPPPQAPPESPGPSRETPTVAETGSSARYPPRPAPHSVSVVRWKTTRVPQLRAILVKKRLPGGRQLSRQTWQFRLAQSLSCSRLEHAQSIVYADQLCKQVR